MTRVLLFASLVLSATAWATPSGKKWQLNGSPVGYRVFAHTGINGLSGFASNVLPAVENGFARWPAAQCSGGKTSWATSYLGSFNSPGDRTAIGNDSQNRVIWLGGADWTHGAQTLGLTTTTYYTNTGQIFDADMELNNDRVWKLGGTTANQVDVESIVTHEAGHYLGLDHSAPTSAVMYAYYDSVNGELKRNLTSNDVADVCTVYPPSTSTGGQQGDFCTGDAQCSAAAGLKCRGAPNASSMICTAVCTTNANCPTGYTCQSATPSGMACLPPTGAPDLCKFCTAGSQCSTGLCVTNGPQNWCTRTCLQSSDCGTGFSCVQGTTSKVCQPDNNKCPAAQCTSSSSCPVGYGCTNGMCEATGSVGDRCEVSVWCQPCARCILDGNGPEATCRACCTGGTGDACAGCNSSSCPSGFGCFTVTNTADAICYPQTGTSSCQACSTTSPCQQGLTCYDGRCHAACNPQSPGSCGACIDSGAGAGLCACSGEAAATGSPCGQLASGYVVCTTGNACVGAPKTCRARCDLSNPNSCGSGEACQNVDGAAVCVPANTAGQRCGPCQSGTCAAGLTCVSGRCYESCNVSLPACTTCVEAAAGVGVCACSDQLSAVGQACGVVTGEVYGCGSGAVCLGGVCRAQCDPNAPYCPGGEPCTLQGIGYACVPQGVTPGQDAGTPGGGGGKADAGTGSGGGVNDAGCGCGSAPPAALAAWALMSVLALSRRRRG